MMKKFIELIFYYLYWAIWKIEAFFRSDSRGNVPSPSPEISSSASSMPEQGSSPNKKFVGSLKSKRKRYHYPHCRYAMGLSKEDEIWFQNPGEALDAGYEACGFCQNGGE